MLPSLSRREVLVSLIAEAASGRQEPSAADSGDITKSGQIPLYCLPTLDDLAKASLDRSIDSIFVSGYHSPGRGGAFYRRVDREPQHFGKVRSADGAWWEIVPDDVVDVLQFGACGDGQHDDTRAIQQALDFAIYTVTAPKRVYLPAGRYLVSDTLHVGYGEEFMTVEVRGEPSIAPGTPRNPAAIIANFSDRPCLNVQGGRRVRLKGLTIFGVNRAHVNANYDKFSDRTSLPLWFGPELTEGSNNAHAPYAGIVIDAYTGPRPDKAYPTVSYPAFLGIRDQYDKHQSSDTILEDCRIEGFCVGLAVQPGIVPDASNGDFVTVRDCNFSFNVVGYADGHTDARCTNIYNSRLHFNHTAIDTVTYGPGKGNFNGHISGSSFDNNARILNVNIGAGFPIKFDGCYGESVYRIGDIYSSGRDASGIAFDGCKFEFSIKNDEYSPVRLIAGGPASLSFRNCNFQGGFGIHRIDAFIDVEGLSFSHPQSSVFANPIRAGSVANSYTTGLWASRSARIRINPQDFFAFSGQHLSDPPAQMLDSESFPVDFPLVGETAATPIPWWVNHLAYAGTSFPVGHIPPLPLDRARFPLAELHKSGNEYFFNVDPDFLDVLESMGIVPSYAFGPGDIVDDMQTGYLFYIVGVNHSSVDGRQNVGLAIRQINAVRTRDYGTSWEAMGTLSENVGTLVFHNARRFYPALRRATLEARAGSPIVKLVSPDALGEASDPIHIVEGDHIISTSLSSAPNELAFRRGRVVEIDRSTGQVTLDEAAIRNYWGDTFVFVKGSA